MNNIKIYNKKQIKETFKELKVSKETFNTMEYKYSPIKENLMALGWGEPTCLEAIETIIIGRTFDTADEAADFFIENYAHDTWSSPIIWLYLQHETLTTNFNNSLKSKAYEQIFRLNADYNLISSFWKSLCFGHEYRLYQEFYHSNR